MYYYDHFSFYKNKWFVHLKILSIQEKNDSLEYITNTNSTYKLTSMLVNSIQSNDPKDISNYKVITKKFQIDKDGKLIVSSAWNFRCQTSKDQEMGFNTPLDTQAVRYATQYDYDKFCFENPDSRFPFDWNAEVYKAFISPTKVRMITKSFDDSDDEDVLFDDFVLNKKNYSASQ